MVILLITKNIFNLIDVTIFPLIYSQVYPQNSNNHSRMLPVPTVSACNTCRAAFSSVEKLRDHYRGEWHAFNSKRRANSLAPLSLKEYATVAPSAKSRTSAKPNSISARNSISDTVPDGSDRNGNNANKLVENVHVPEIHQGRVLAINSLGVSSAIIDNETAKYLAHDLATSFLTNSSVSVSLGEGDELPVSIMEGSEGNQSKGDDADEWTDDENEADVSEHHKEGGAAADDNDNEDILTAMEPNVSIFDNKVFPGDNGVAECVGYMAETFGFFIPDIEYVSDLPGLLIYLGEKVKHGGICLYCQKQFRPGWPCQNHMISKSHCKIAYEEEVDVDEYEDFYDFSSLDDNGVGLEDIEVSNIGELVLPDKTVGHRAYLKYYKQRFKQPDTRPAVLAQQREEIARLGVRFGGLNFNDQQLLKMSYVDISAILAKQHKEATKNTKMQQRAEQKYQYRNNRRMYQSTVDKLRSSETTTEKIRDYHKIL